MIKKADVTTRYTRGKGPGGQNRNKVHSCVVLTHNPTGVTVRIDGRDRWQNERQAWEELESRVLDLLKKQVAAKKKNRRDNAIQDGGTPIIRTYDFKDGMARDHRTKKKAPLKEVLGKGRIDLMR